MLLPLRHPKGWLIIGWLLVIGATVLNLLPLPPIAEVPSGFDKIEHVVGYAGLTMWFTGIYPKSRYTVIAILLFMLGVAIEWLQGAMALGRVRDYRDVMANCIGIGAGLLLALTWLGGWAQRLEEWARERTSQ